MGSSTVFGLGVAIVSLALLASPACRSEGSGSGGAGASGTSSDGAGPSTGGGDTSPGTGGTGAGSTTTTTTTPGGGGGVVGESPTATITSPHDGDAFAANTDIPFTGTATDPQDGALPDLSMAWVGDIAGAANPEGFGPTCNVSFSTTGPHTVTLTATDSDGNTGSQTITVDIQ